VDSEANIAFSKTPHGDPRLFVDDHLRKKAGDSDFKMSTGWGALQEFNIVLAEGKHAVGRFSGADASRIFAVEEDLHNGTNGGGAFLWFSRDAIRWAERWGAGTVIELWNCSRLLAAGFKMGQIDLKSGFQQVRAGADGFQVGERNFADECIPTGAALEELAELLLAPDFRNGTPNQFKSS